MVATDFNDTDKVADTTKNDIPANMSDLTTIDMKNPRIHKVLALEEEATLQKQLEQDRTKRIQVELEYLHDLLNMVNDDFTYSKEEQNANTEFEQRIQSEVYRMHGLSADKLQGMDERRNALYQGAAFSMLFLSVIMVALCGILHGFGSQICLFMAFYTALEASLLSHKNRGTKLLDGLTRAIYMILFPVMMVIFVCFELEFSQYEWLLPILTVAGLVILLLGAASYFLYDPYKADRKNRKKADRYLAEMEKTALKDVRLRETELKKRERREEKKRIRAEKKAKRQTSSRGMKECLFRPHKRKNERKEEEETDVGQTQEGLTDTDDGQTKAVLTVADGGQTKPELPEPDYKQVKTELPEIENKQAETQLG